VTGGRLVTRNRSRAIRLALAAFAVAGLAIAIYLAVTRLNGGLPACGPVAGCETVALSEYSELFGVPVAFLGAAFSAALLGGVAAWLRLGRRRLLYVVYAAALFGLVFVSYLTYLELFVIHAICVWCAAYAVSMVATFIAAAVAVRSLR
jgi:uncharacterized membrane protein